MKITYSSLFRIVPLALAVVFSANSFGQINSVKDGVWLSPFTWNCTCIPGTTDVVIIKHEVIMTSDWGLGAGGSITVDTMGIYRENAPGKTFGQMGGSFVNWGVVDISNFAVTAGQTTNNDSMHVGLALYITGSGSLINNGKISEVDSIWNDGILNNKGPLAEITGRFFYNTDSLYNSGGMGFLEGFNDAGVIMNDGLIATTLFFNDGYMENGSGSVFSSMDFWNNDQFLNLGGAYTSLTRDFANGDTLFPISGPYLYNDGFIGVGRDFYNADVIDGDSGQLCISEFSGNWGVVQGSSDICDASTGTFDMNTGSIAPTVTNCASTCRLVVSIAGYEPSCSGGSDGSIAIKVYGGSPPYSYLWSSGETADSIGGLVEGAYFVLISDGVDSTYALIDLDTPSLLSSVVSTPSSCEQSNGSAAVTVSQGTQPYSYLWSDSVAQTTVTATGLNQGTFTVVITDNNGCSIIDSAIVSGSPMLSLVESVTFPSCPNTPDGRIDIAITGGTAPYNYVWTPNISDGPFAADITAGLYDIKVIDINGCSDSVSISAPGINGPDCSDWKIFNGITPNGDEIDDFWEIRGLKQYDKVGVQIFSNRGVIVWESDQYDNDWEGTDQEGNILMEGVYYYIVTRPEQIDKGWVHISR